MQAISTQLTEAQQTFLKNYRELLTEVESAINYVSECYIKNDHDIGDRLLKSVMQGLIPYNEENLTIQSIFQKDAEAIEALNLFQEAALQAEKVEEVFPHEQERMVFLHETLLPRKRNWTKIIDKYIMTH
ncbi:hypothetical protein [Salipaludibacillus aurantiacus]|uniref:DUF8042 domain-containing protein n=1 Tax=Salipaludibacillus aurantiacus TaxID=1601833 RepID=A0A1H9WY32_9BACI|nr:hypothetical protein [Salipaludibacillus aurantiacus]SES38729.1 hypothetical protein SAMN05518684_12130 [Salipaludibacillus aurantiacus]